MIQCQRSQEPEDARFAESALISAADYEPKSSMPEGLEERAMARIQQHKRYPTARALALTAGGLVLVICIIKFAVGGSVAPSSGVAKNEERAAVQRRAVAIASGKQNFHLGGSNGAPARKLGTWKTRPSNGIALAATGSAHVKLSAIPSAVHRKRQARWRLQAALKRSASRQIVLRHAQGGQGRSLIVLSKAAHSVPTVWRTETIETSTVSYIAPGLVASTPDAQGHITHTSAAVVVPVQTTNAHYRALPANQELYFSPASGNLRSDGNTKSGANP